MKVILWILRVAVGLLFIFSGMVKANDPLGLTYKMNEFFEVWNMGFMLEYSLGFSIAMIAFEIIAGFAMIVGNHFRLYVTLLLLLNIFFTFLTGYVLYSGKIKECGCFGDCIKISNTATFYKDIVLTAAVLFLFIFRYRVFPLFNKSAINASIVGVGAVIAFGFQYHVLHHLPYHDCLPYKVGNNIWEKMQPEPNATPAVFATTFVYEKNGVKQDFTSENYPWKDPSWKFVSSKSVEITPATGESEIHDFSLTDSNDNDQTQAILTAKGYTFIWFLREPEKANKDNMDVLRSLMNKAKAMNIPFYVACSAGRDICITYQEAWNMKDIPFMTMDVTVSKTVMRTNPGLMLLKDGVVMNKWSYLDYPKELALP
ncbi:MAG: DoxX family protein [Taibaiella sp.]|nr:DoxX family protein [Taibaiella sp.]